MFSMIDIEGKIVSTDLLTEGFLCDLSSCDGMCCVEGNAGAPLDKEELEILALEFENYRDYMTPEGREVIEREGFYVVDEDGDLTTPLIGEMECAYSCGEGGVTHCAIEKAYRDGKTSFIKPISCHLYPIRVTRFSDGSLGLNYHRWSVCQAARELGSKMGVPIYKSLKEPIVRSFGEEFFEALDAAAEYLKQQQN